MWDRLILKMELSNASQGECSTLYCLFQALHCLDTEPYTGTNVFRDALCRLAGFGLDPNCHFMRNLAQHFGTRVERDIREGRGERS